MTNLIAQGENEIVLETAQGQPVLVRYSPTAFEILGNDGGVTLSTSPRNLLQISVARQSDSPARRLPITIAALVTSAGNLALWKKDFWIAVDEQQSAEEWAERIVSLAYGGTLSWRARCPIIQRFLSGVKRGRKVALLLNPIGGKGKARELVKSVALPILEAAGLQVEVYGMFATSPCEFSMLKPEIRYPETQHAKHAELIAQDLPLDFE